MKVINEKGEYYCFNNGKHYWSLNREDSHDFISRLLAETIARRYNGRVI
jgi:hypothetical protein